MIKRPIDVPAATLPFCTYRSGGRQVIEFDSTGCACPVPMRNAMAGLERIAATGETLVMLNGFEPQGLYERVRGAFEWSVEVLDPQRVMVIFTATERSAAVDFSQRHCNG